MNRSASGDSSFKQLIKLCSLIVLVSIASACDFLLKPEGGPKPLTDNPGINAPLPSAFPVDASANNQRMTTAQRQTQSCPEGQTCSETPNGRLEYTYDNLTGLLLSTLECDGGSCLTQGAQEVYREYAYSSSTRLDKIAVADSNSSNFHTLHDYTYDDENDPSDFNADPVDGFSALPDLTKLRMEYICKELNFTSADINNIAADGEVVCTRDGVDPDTGDSVEYFRADEAIHYVYYESGYLYRKVFDVNNDGKADHQKIYRYRNGSQLRRVDTDNHFDGVIDERYQYESDDDDSQRAFLDNGYDSRRSRGIDVTVSYELGGDSEVLRECYFRADLDDQEDGLWEEGECTSGSRESFHWEFTWEDASGIGGCWAGGLDDIDPEARAINYLCKE